MRLNEYRIQIIGRLKCCRDTVAARGILAEADLVLMNSHLKRLTQDKFWETLHDDLDALAEDARFVTDREARLRLSTVVVAARARIERCLAEELR